MKPSLVAYFSASGVTARLAIALAEAAGADLYEICPAVPYSEADLNWNDPRSRSTVEMKDLAFRPPMADMDANVAAYDLIFIGFPIWWYIAPTIINTFLESYDFSGKTIVPFATSGGSGLGQTVEKLKPSAATAHWAEARLINGTPDMAALAAWAEGITK